MSHPQHTSLLVHETFFSGALPHSHTSLWPIFIWIPKPLSLQSKNPCHVFSRLSCQSPHSHCVQCWGWLGEKKHASVTILILVLLTIEDIMFPLHCSTPSLFLPWGKSYKCCWSALEIWTEIHFDKVWGFCSLETKWGLTHIVITFPFRGDSSTKSCSPKVSTPWGQPASLLLLVSWIRRPSICLPAQPSLFKEEGESPS